MDLQVAETHLQQELLQSPLKTVKRYFIPLILTQQELPKFKTACPLQTMRAEVNCTPNSNLA